MRVFWVEQTLIILEIVIASTAVALILLSLKTWQAIKSVGVGRSFWMPVAVSGFLFFFGSMLGILFELNFSLTEYTVEVVQVSRLLGLCTLVAGVYSYSRKVTMNLGQKFTLSENDARAEDTVEIETPVMVAPNAVQGRQMQVSSGRGSDLDCRHQFGHLRTLRMDAPIPDECLSCSRIIECKHSLEKPKKGQQRPSRA